MTDEEIEFALKQYVIGGGRNVVNMDWAAALDYINRLKAENEDMYGELMNLRAYIDNHEEIWKHNAEIDKAIVRKDTAKEIWQSLYNECCRNPDLYNITLNRNDIIIQARCHGVEVDDE